MWRECDKTCKFALSGPLPVTIILTEILTDKLTAPAALPTLKSVRSCVFFSCVVSPMTADPSDSAEPPAELEPETPRSTAEGAEMLRGLLPTLPGKAGVYRMLDHAGTVLYVGKAKNQIGRAHV